MKHAIEITDDLMHVLDENGYGHDAHILVDCAAARRQIETWAAECEFDVAAAGPKGGIAVRESRTTFAPWVWISSATLQATPLSLRYAAMGYGYQHGWRLLGGRVAIAVR